jgi:hypothetical protein
MSMLAVSAMTALVPLLDALSVPVGRMDACPLPVSATDLRAANARPSLFVCARDIGCTRETG